MRLTVRTRINFTGLIAATGLIVVLAIAIFKLSAVMRSEAANSVRHAVETAHGVLAHYRAEEESGRMRRADAQRAALSTLSALRYGDKDYFWVNDMQPRMLMHPTRPELDGTDLTGNRDADGNAMFVSMVALVRADGAGFLTYNWNKPGETEAVPKLSYVKGFAPWGWVIGSGVYIDNVRQGVLDAVLSLGLLALLVLGAVGFGCRSIGRSISLPVEALAQRMRTLAAGDTQAAIPCLGRQDEIGAMSDALVVFRDAAIAAKGRDAEQQVAVGAVGHGLDALAGGDLATRIDADLPGAFAKIRTDFNAAMASVGGTIRAVAEAANDIRTSAGEISAASDDLSRRTEQQAASLAETTAAMGRITESMHETAAGAAHANAVVSATRGDAEEGGRIVRQAVDAMNGIERASNEISEIISVIDGIAFQTNLLALNAGVEAARAGDAGRGFAVVASEVRALAQRSADAAKDVKLRIDTSTEQVEAGVMLVNRTGRSLERIVARIGEVSMAVDGITTSTKDQASGLQQVNSAVGEMDMVTQQNAAMVEQSNAAARSLAAEAEALADQVGRFRLAQGGAPVTVIRPATAPRRQTGGRRSARGGAALAIADDDWSAN